MRNEPLWVVQSNLGSSGDVAAIQRACAELGLPCTLVAAIPFSDELPDVPTDRKAVFYGSANFVTTVHRSGRWNPGAFFDERLFRFSEILKRYGEAVLNADAVLTTMGELADRAYPDDKLLFVRPDGDLKEFAGSLLTFGELKAWCERLRPGGFSIGLDTPIVAAEPRRIDHEWRLFIVEGKVVAGSHYRAAGELAVWADVPEPVVSFAEELAATWSPALAFVMDVAEAEGRYAVLEINGMNSSGFYASDIKTIVRTVSDAVIRLKG